MASARPAASSPIGFLADGTPFYAPLGELIHDAEDRVQCHLCGGWYRLIGSTHVRAGTERYRVGCEPRRVQPADFRR